MTQFSVLKMYLPEELINKIREIDICLDNSLAQNANDKKFL